MEERGRKVGEGAFCSSYITMRRVPNVPKLPRDIAPSIHFLFSLRRLYRPHFVVAFIHRRSSSGAAPPACQ